MMKLITNALARIMKIFIFDEPYNAKNKECSKNKGKTIITCLLILCCSMTMVQAATPQTQVKKQQQQQRFVPKKGMSLKTLSRQKGVLWYLVVQSGLGCDLYAKYGSYIISTNATYSYGNGVGLTQEGIQTIEALYSNGVEMFTMKDYHFTNDAKILSVTKRK